METVVKYVVLGTFCGMLLALFSFLLHLSMQRLIEAIKEQKSHKREQRCSLEKKLAPNKAELREQVDELKERISVLEFKDRVPEGIELSYNIKRFDYIVTCFVQYIYSGKIKTVTYLESFFAPGVECIFPSRHKVYKNTNCSIIIDAEGMYFKVEKDTGNVMDVTELIHEQEQENEGV